MRSNGNSSASPSPSLTETVFSELESMIVDGKLGIGDHINELAFAEQRGISRGPIREACRRLEEIGLVELKANRGFFVREISLEEVLEIYDVRAALFAHAGRVLARRITDLHLEELTEINKQMQAAYVAEDFTAFQRLNRHFHSRIMSFTGNKRLSAVYEDLDRRVHLWRKRALVLDSNIRPSVDDHECLLELLRNGNPTRISRFMRDHSLSGRNRLLRTMSNQLSGLTQALWNDDDF